MVASVVKDVTMAVRAALAVNAIPSTVPLPQPPKMDPATHLRSVLPFAGASISEDFISEEVEGKLLDASWKLVRPSPRGGRDTVQFGWTIDLASPRAPLRPPAKGAGMCDMPHCMFEVMTRVCKEFETPQPLHDALLINAYAVGQGLGAHTDHRQYGDMVGVLSLGEGATLQFSNAEGAWYDVHLPGRSLFFFWGEARWQWKHAILGQQSGARVSLTFRSVSIR